MTALIPRMPGHWLAGQYAQMREDPIALFSRAVKEHGDFVRMRFFHIPLTVVNDAEAVRAILETRADNYPREANSSQVMRAFVGDGILTANGAHWVMQRTSLEPHLQKKPVHALFPLMRQELDGAFGRWHGELDIARETKVIGFKLMVQLLFGYCASTAEAEEFTDGATFGQEDVMDRLMSIAAPPLALPIARNAKLKSVMRFAHGLCAKMIREGDAKGRYLSAVLEAAPNAHWARQMMMTLLIVGSENPSNTVAWALALLAKHPEVLKAVVDEVRAAPSLETPEDLASLRVTHRVLHETMRLYPGGWALDRKALTEDTLGPYRIPAGGVVLVSPFLMHRNPRYWANPEQFDPDRFLPERRAQLPKFAYFPFGGGPHRCLGPTYAYQFMPLFLAHFLQRFDYQPVSSQLPEPQALFTLRPRGGVRLRLTEAR